jgi:hypothetical protein
MDETVLSGLRYDNEDAALTSLLEAVGSVFTLREIAAAYCDAGKDTDMAVEILYDKQGSTSSSVIHGSASEATCKDSEVAVEVLYDKQGSSSSSVIHGSTSEARTEKSSGLSYTAESSSTVNDKFKASKPRKYSVSAGSVSSVIGRDYLKPAPQTKDSCVETKPLRIDSTEFPASEVWTEGDGSNPIKDEQLQKDMEEFLFKMLGEGFQLSRDMIQDVLGKCGYDMHLSMEKLVKQSAESSYRRSRCLSKSPIMSADAHPNSVEPSSERELSPMSSSRGQQKERADVEKDLLSSLFNVPERCEYPKRIERAARRPEVFGRVVTGPLRKLSEHKQISIPSVRDVQDDDHGEGSFLALRKEVKEFRGMMKEYYTAAVDAFAKGERIRAKKLLEQGQFFHQKAREKDEEAAQKIFKPRNTEDENEVMPVNLLENDPKEGLRLLRCHIQSLAGNGCFKYLKVVMEKDAEDMPKSTRRKRVMKFLESDSIEWREGENAGTILIPLEKIDRNSLRFLKKKQEA